MNEYLILQYRMLNRHLREFGINPILGYLLASIVFFSISSLLFNKTTFAPYIYSGIALLTIGKLSELHRCNFLKTCFPRHTYRNIRILENIILGIPFIAFLLYKQEYQYLPIIFLSVLAFYDYNYRNIWNFTIPTPFGKRPYEFTRGFRNTFFIFPLAYSLCIIGINVNNFNLSLFSLGVIVVLCISYYAETESKYFVWIHAMSPKKFILYKVATGFGYLSLTIAPMIILLHFFYPLELRIILLVVFFGYLNLACMILAKYAAYPRDVSLPQVIIYCFGFFFPPLLLFILPHFYNQAIRKLYYTLS